MPQLRYAPRAPLLTTFSPGTNPELIVNTGVNVKHNKLALAAHVGILKVTGGTFPILKTIILRHKVVIHLKAEKKL